MGSFSRTSDPSLLEHFLTEPEPPHKFPKFLSLPTELQLQVYKIAFAIQLPRIVILTKLSHTETKGNQYVEGQTYTPALLQVCRRAREECLPLYTTLIETTCSAGSLDKPVYVNASIDKLRIRYDGNGLIDQGYTYNLSKDAIAEFQHFEIIVKPMELGGQVKADIRWLFLITDDLAKNAPKPILSITVIISMLSHDELERHRLCGVEEERERARIRWEIVRAARWEPIRVELGGHRFRSKHMVHPLEDTEVFLGYEVEGKSKSKVRRGGLGGSVLRRRSGEGSWPNLESLM